MRPYIYAISFMIFSAVGIARGQSAKVGVVDLQRVYLVLQTASVESRTLENAERQLEQEIAELQGKGYERRKAGMPESKADKEEYRKNYERLEGRRLELHKQRAALVKSQRERIREALRQVGGEQGYTVILDAETVPFYKEAEDVTERVLIKLGLPTSGPKG